MRRLAALLYDSFLVVAVWFVIAFMLQRIVGTQSNKLIDGVVQTDPLLDALLFTIMVTSGSGFYIWFWTKSGQTLGMIAWRIKLESLDGGLINFKQGMIRYIAAWPAFLLLGLGCHLILCLGIENLLLDCVQGFLSFLLRFLRSRPHQ